MQHRHQWQPLGGIETNPGCFDRGNGNMIFVALCKCGKVRVEGTNYAGRGADWKRMYASKEEYMHKVWGQASVASV